MEWSAAGPRADKQLGPAALRHNRELTTLLPTPPVALRTAIHSSTSRRYQSSELWWPQVRTGKQGEGAAGATRIGYANAVWHLVRGRVATARHG